MNPFDVMYAQSTGAGGGGGAVAEEAVALGRAHPGTPDTPSRMCR